MNGDSQFKREDVEALAGELQDLKEIVREVSGKLGRIEKRLRLFFPQSFPIPAPKQSKTPVGDVPPTITPQQALGLYSELLEMARTGREQQVEARVAGMDLPDLALLVRELGAPLGKKPTRPGLTKSLMGRLRESMMLSRHTVRPASNQSATPEESTKVLTGDNRHSETSKSPESSDKSQK
jgi:hypothetical protein